MAAHYGGQVLCTPGVARVSSVAATHSQGTQALCSDYLAVGLATVYITHAYILCAVKPHAFQLFLGGGGDDGGGDNGRL